MNKELSNALNENLQGCIEIEPLYSLHCRKRYLEYTFKEWIEENYNKRLFNIVKPSTLLFSIINLPFRLFL